jgi:hypothetical protein
MGPHGVAWSRSEGIRRCGDVWYYGPAPLIMPRIGPEFSWRFSRLGWCLAERLKDELIPVIWITCSASKMAGNESLLCLTASAHRADSTQSVGAPFTLPPLGYFSNPFPRLWALVRRCSRCWGEGNMWGLRALD